MKMSVAYLSCSALLLGLLATGHAAAMPVEIDGIEAVETVPQGQVFYGGNVSMISAPGGQRCMVSTGTDWKNRASVRRASDVDQPEHMNSDRREIFAATTAVPIAGLASNTPYLQAIIAPDGSVERFRIAAGFAITPGSVELRLGEDPSRVQAPLALEERGDTALLSDMDVAGAVLATFGRGEILEFSARSKKLLGAEAEHVISYEFDGGFDPDALSSCLTDLNDARTVALTPTPALTLTPVKDEDPAIVARLRGMACNRALDLEEAELVALSGQVGGFASPLSHALLLRDDEGAVEHVVSGDLWRISRTADGYDMAVSRSITAQSPLIDQAEKACTRYDAARCVNMTIDPDTGAVHVAECLGVFMAESVDTPGPVSLGPGFPPLVVAGPIGGTSPGPSTSSPGPGTPTPPTSPTPPGPGVTPPTIPVIPTPPTVDPTDPNTTDPNEITNIPVPGGLILLMTGLLGLFAFTRYRT